MSKAILSIGSNMSDRVEELRRVYQVLVKDIVGASRIWETQPWGGVAQDMFLNAILIAENPEFSPYDWLKIGQELERQAGRQRGIRWGPRPLDVDIVSCWIPQTVQVPEVAGQLSDPPDSADQEYVEVLSDDEELTLPHPRAAQRAFVLVPWLDVDPVATLRGTPVSSLVASLSEEERAEVSTTDVRWA